jgi:hypothetical protein
MKRTPSSSIERLLNRDVSDGQIVKEIIAEEDSLGCKNREGNCQ